MNDDVKPPAEAEQPLVQVATVPEPAWLELWEQIGPGRCRHLGQPVDMPAAKDWVARCHPSRRFYLRLMSMGQTYLEFWLRSRFGAEPLVRVVWFAELDEEK